MAIWTTACVILAVISAANLILNLGLVTRVRDVQEAAASRPPPSRFPDVGRAVRPFELSAVDGATISDGALQSGTTVVGFFTTGCRICARVRSTLSERPPAVPVVIMINGDPDEPQARSMGESLSRVCRVAYFDDLSVARAFGVLGYPTLLRIQGGTIAAVGRDLDEIGFAA